MSENIDKDKISENLLNENENSNNSENINEPVTAQECIASSQVEEVKSDENIKIEESEPSNDEKAAKLDEMELKTDAIEDPAKENNVMEQITDENCQEVTDLVDSNKDLVQNENVPAQIEEQKSDEIQTEKTIDEIQPDNLTSTEEPVLQLDSKAIEENNQNKDDISEIVEENITELTITSDIKEDIVNAMDESTKIEETPNLTEESQKDESDTPSTSEGMNY